MVALEDCQIAFLTETTAALIRSLPQAVSGAVSLNKDAEAEK